MVGPHGTLEFARTQLRGRLVGPFGDAPLREEASLSLSLSLSSLTLPASAKSRWLLARRSDNRVALGRLWAVDGLVHALKSNARLDVKEG